MTNLLRAHLFLLLVNIIYGANYIIAKGLMLDKIGPSGFILLRVSGAILLFWLLLFFLYKYRNSNAGDKNPGNSVFIKRSDLPRLILCGVTGVAVNQLCFFNGLNLTSPINSAIIMTSNPILVLLISVFFMKEAVNKWRLAGVVAGAVGAISLIQLSKADVAGISSMEGDLLILLNSASYAVYLVLVKPLMQRYHPVTVIAWVFLFGFMIVMPFGWQQLWNVDWSGLSNWEWFAVFYVVIATTFLAYLLNITALKFVPATMASSYIYIQPVLAGVFAWIFSFYIQEDYTADISVLKVLCALLIFVGVYLVSKPVVKV